MSGSAPGAAAGHPDPGLTGAADPARSPASRVPWRRAATPGGLPLAVGTDHGIAPAIRWDPWAELPDDRAAALLRLRGADDADPVDTDPSTRHVWIDDPTGPVAALRVRPVEPDAETALLVECLTLRADVRDLGLAGALVTEVVARCGGRPLVADVPADALALFTRFEFAATATVLDTADRIEALTRMRRTPEVPWREA